MALGSRERTGIVQLQEFAKAQRDAATSLSPRLSGGAEGGFLPHAQASYRPQPP
jgi:hypothetical protein